MAEIPVRIFGGPIQRDVDAPRRICSKKIRPGFINQSSVRVDRQNHAHVSELEIQCLKIRKKQRLTAGQKKEKKIADDETVKKLIKALEAGSILYEAYFKLIIATGMRRGECCALKWEDINYAERSIHVCRNAVKTTGDEIIVKAPKTKAGNRYVYFSAEMESLLREYEAFCAAETERYDRREQTKDDYVFRRKGMKLPMTPSTFTWRFKKILKANDLPTDLNVHSLRHTAASLFIASGTDVGTVAGLLGHSQPSTTLDIYTHAFDKNKKVASQIMQSSLEI